MLWQKLSKIALLGTAQAGLAADVRQALEREGLDTDMPEEVVLLEGAALLGQLQKATLPLKKLEMDLPPAVASGDDRIISSRAAQHLRKILDGTFAPALSEFFYFLREYKKQLPPELLPALLDACLENPEFWQQVEPLLGERGEWLLTQNPKWQRLRKRKTDRNGYIWQPDAEQAKQALHYLHTLKKVLSGSNAPYYASQDDRQQLRYAAYDAPPGKYDVIADGWRVDFRVSMAWEKEIERLLRTIAFRRSMRQALKE